MLCSIDEVKQISAAFMTIDRLLVNREELTGRLNSAEKEKGRVLRKHGLLFFIIKAVLFSAAWFAGLEFIYAVFPKDFPYYILAPVFGICTEYIFKRRYAKNEMKSLIKDLDSQMKECTDEIAEIDGKITELSFFAESRLQTALGYDKEYMRNLVCLAYIARTDANGKKISMLARYNDFVNKLNCIEEDEENPSEIKAKIDAAQVQARYRKQMTDSIIKNGVNENEEN